MAAEAILFGVAQTIIENLGSTAFEEIGSVWGVKDEFEKLRDTVSAVQAVLLDAEEQQVKNHRVKHWLMKLRDAIYDADDLLTEFYTEDMRQRVMGGDDTAKRVRTSMTTFFTRSNQFALRYNMAKNLTAMRERFDAIANDMNKFQLVVHPLQTRVLTRERDHTYSFVREEEVIGREEDKKAIINLLLDFDVQENVSFISIVGIGGLGKTALAQYVYNDEKVKNYFELQMWVCVSDVFDVKAIAEKIIGSAMGTKPENLDMDQLQIKLRGILNQKNYFLVLDDVWNENEESWCNLKRILMCGSKGSKVVITTRTKLVAEITCTISPYVLQGLSKDKSWILFKQMAFKKGPEKINPNLEAIGRNIVQKCCGVPLAIKVIGRILYFKKTEDEWLYMKNKELIKVTQEENNNGILSILKLSYDHLPSYLKCCFAYCSLFPKDHVISKLTLIRLWIAQGFIWSSNEKLHLEDVANEYCMDLVWRSFFQEVREDDFGNIVSFKMHDLMHDLAQSVSMDDCTLVDSNAGNINEYVRHLSIASHNVLEKNLDSSFKAKKIRTFILCNSSIGQGKEESILEGKIFNFKCLRALDLHGLDIAAVPNSVDKLKYLKYLDLSRNSFTVLPCSIIRLLNLQTLKLSDCFKLKELPRDIQKLVNLRSLEIDGCHSLTHMPPGIGQLTSLQVLPLFIVNKELTTFSSQHCGGLAELNKLNNLRGELCITILAQVKDATLEAKAANLMDKQHLRKLEYRWHEMSKDITCVGEDENLMEGLQPHRSLKILYVEGYQGLGFPSWLPSLTSLVELKIVESRCQHLPPMYQLPYLRNLSLEYMLNLEYISDQEITDEISGSATFFPSLESLNLMECPNLKGWWRRDIVHVGTSESLPSFPRLSKLVMGNCSNLTCMPLFPYVEGMLSLYNISCKPLQQTMEMPMNITATSSLSSSSYSSLPPLSKLKSLYLGSIQDLDFLPEKWMQNMDSLENLSIVACSRLKSVSLSLAIQHLTSLKSLEIRDCEEVDLLIDDEPQCVIITTLQRLWISEVPHLITLPVWIGNLTSLQKLAIFNCHNLISLPEEMHCLSSLQTLTIINCHRLKKENVLKWIAGVPNVEIF